MVCSDGKRGREGSQPRRRTSAGNDNEGPTKGSAGQEGQEQDAQSDRHVVPCAGKRVAPPRAPADDPGRERMSLSPRHLPPRASRPAAAAAAQVDDADGPVRPAQPDDAGVVLVEVGREGLDARPKRAQRELGRRERGRAQVVQRKQAGGGGRADERGRVGREGDGVHVRVVWCGMRATSASAGRGQGSERAKGVGEEGRRERNGLRGWRRSPCVPVSTTRAQRGQRRVGVSPLSSQSRSAGQGGADARREPSRPTTRSRGGPSGRCSSRRWSPPCGAHASGRWACPEEGFGACAQRGQHQRGRTGRDAAPRAGRTDGQADVPQLDRAVAAGRRDLARMELGPRDRMDSVLGLEPERRTTAGAVSRSSCQRRGRSERTYFCSSWSPREGPASARTDTRPLPTRPKLAGRRGRANERQPSTQELGEGRELGRTGRGEREPVCAQRRGKGTGYGGQPRPAEWSLERKTGTDWGQRARRRGRSLRGRACAGTGRPSRRSGQVRARWGASLRAGETAEKTPAAAERLPPSERPSHTSRHHDDRPSQPRPVRGPDRGCPRRYVPAPLGRL